MQVAIYIYKDDIRYRLELFQDENISITSSIQNVNDISKVFTDYSSSFSVPATPNNNKIFAHWYENSIDNGFNANLRYDAEIEINYVPFRKGRIELQGAVKENGVIKNYSLVFYGKLKALTDLFKDSKLKELIEINDLISFTYNATNVVNNVVNSNTDDIAFPLIANRVWQIGGGDSYDITSTSGEIKYSELFPAVRLNKVFEAIEQKYNIDFQGPFLTDKRFTEAFLFCKNSENIKVPIQNINPDFTSTSGYFPTTTIDLVNNKITFNGNIIYEDESTDIIVNGTSTDDFKIHFYKNDDLYITYQGSAGSYAFSAIKYTNTTEGIGDVWRYKIETANIVGFTFSIEVNTVIWGGSGNSIGNISTSLSYSTTLDFTLYLPDIKISDFFAGILKMFNLTCYSEEEGIYKIESLNDWYNSGRAINITKYITNDADINRSKPYKEINFTYEKSESLINRAFYDTFTREYGDLKYTFNSDGDTYDIKLPFENLMHQKFSGTKLHVGFTLKSDLKPYIPKPILLYKYGNISTDVNFYLEGSNRTSYNAFSQDVEKTTGLFYTLNWGLENSTLLDGVIENTLFATYYLDYLQNIYSLKSRLINVKGIADTKLIADLKLNDKVIIRDKRYVINQMTTTLTNGEINLELLTDFRAI